MLKFNIICMVVVLLIEADYFLLKKWRIKRHRVFPDWKTKIVILIGVLSPLVNLIASL